MKKVRVINIGYTYPNYEDFFKEYNLMEYKKMGVENELPSTTEIYDLIFRCAQTTECLIKKDNRVYIMNVCGLEKVETNEIENIECPYCQGDKDKMAKFVEKDADTIILRVKCDECGKEFLQAYEVAGEHKITIVKRDN
jgi:hypothetical protein